MSFKVVILKSAKLDLKETRDYIVKNFSHAVWLATSAQVKSSIEGLAILPFAGAVPSELETVNLNDYRQVISGMNRIIYEIRQDIVFVHAVIDVRRDLISFLTKRLLRSSR
jgi:toxin ParE1/3/4